MILSSFPFSSISQERLRVSVATLQSSIGTLATDVSETKKKQHEAMMDIMTTQTNSVGHTLVDLDSRVENLSMRLQVSIGRFRKWSGMC